MGVADEQSCAANTMTASAIAMRTTFPNVG